MKAQVQFGCFYLFLMCFGVYSEGTTEINQPEAEAEETPESEHPTTEINQPEAEAEETPESEHPTTEINQPEDEAEETPESEHPTTEINQPEAEAEETPESEQPETKTEESYPEHGWRPDAETETGENPDHDNAQETQNEEKVTDDEHYPKYYEYEEEDVTDNEINTTLTIVLIVIGATVGLLVVILAGILLRGKKNGEMAVHKQTQSPEVLDLSVLDAYTYKGETQDSISVEATKHVNCRPPSYQSVTDPPPSYSQLYV